MTSSASRALRSSPGSARRVQTVPAACRYMLQSVANSFVAVAFTDLLRSNTLIVVRTCQRHTMTAAYGCY